MQQTKKSGGVGLSLMLFFCFAVLVFCALLFSSPRTLATKSNHSYSDLDTNEKRVAFLASLGWETHETPVEVCEVDVPLEFDAVYEAYNELQKPLGLDLYPLRGRRLRRYTFVVKNHPDSGTVYANLLFSHNEFVGGDICSATADGFVESLKKSA